MVPSRCHWTMSHHPWQSAIQSNNIWRPPHWLLLFYVTIPGSWDEKSESSKNPCSSNLAWFGIQHFSALSLLLGSTARLLQHAVALLFKFYLDQYHPLRNYLSLLVASKRSMPLASKQMKLLLLFLYTLPFPDGTQGDLHIQMRTAKNVGKNYH